MKQERLTVKEREIIEAVMLGIAERAEGCTSEDHVYVYGDEIAMLCLAFRLEPDPSLVEGKMHALITGDSFAGIEKPRILINRARKLVRMGSGIAEMLRDSLAGPNSYG